MKQPPKSRKYVSAQSTIYGDTEQSGNETHKTHKSHNVT